MARGTKLDTLYYELEARTEGLEKSIGKASTSLQRFTAFIKANPVLALTALGAALVALGAKAAKMAAEFEKGMSEVSTLLDTTQVNMKQFSDETLRLFESLPIESLTDLTKGLYQTISAGVDAADAIDFLRIASEAAVGGVTSVEVAVDGLTSAVNAYKTSGLTAQEAADKFFESVRLGKTTFAEISASIGQVIGTTAAFGISLDDTLGAMVALTKNGVDTQKAFRGIRQVVASILNPADELKQLWPELAAEFNATKLQTEGLTKFLADLAPVLQTDSAFVQALFQDTFAMNAAFTLLKNGAKEVVEVTGQVGRSTGAAATAYRKMQQDTTNVYQTLKNKFSVELIRLGEKLLPPVNLALETMTYWMERLNGEFTRFKTDNAQASLEQLTTTLRSTIGKELSGDPLKRFALELVRVAELSEGINLFGASDLQRVRLAEDGMEAVSEALRAISEDADKNFLKLAPKRLQALREGLQVIRATIEASPELSVTNTKDYERVTLLIQRINELIGKASTASATVVDADTIAKLVSEAAELENIITLENESAGKVKATNEERERAIALQKELQAAIDAGIEDPADRAQAARAVQNLGVALGGLTPDQKAALQAQKEAAEKAAEELATKQQQFLRQTEDAIVNLTTTMVDNAELAFDRVYLLARELFGENMPALVEEWLTAMHEQIDQLRIFEGAEKELDELGTELQRASDLFSQGYATSAANLLPVLEATREKWIGIVANQKEGTAEHERAKAGLAIINGYLARMAGLWGDAADGAGDVADKLDDEYKKLRDITETIEDAARGFLQMADAVGLVDDATADVLQDLIQIGTKVPLLIKQIQALKAGGTAGGLGSVLGVVGAALPVVGGVASLIGGIGSLFGGGPSPEEQARQQALEDLRKVQYENTKVLQQLISAVEGLSDDLTGDEWRGAVNALQKYFADLKRFPQIPQGAGPAGPVPQLPKPPTLEQQLAAEGLTIDDLQAIAEGLGLTFDATAQGLQTLLDALRAYDFAQYAKTVAGQLDAARARIELFDLTDPVDQLEEFFKVLQDQAPAIADSFKAIIQNPFGGPDIFADFDLRTERDRARADARIKELFEALVAGTLDPALLGGFTPKQFEAFLLEMDRLLDTFETDEATLPDGVSQSFSIDRTITEETGSRIAGLLVQNNIWLSEIAGSTLRAANNLDAVVSLMQNGGGIVLNDAIPFPGSPQASITSQVNSALGAQYTRARVLSGTVVQV